jgi:hypothetical protein
VRFVDPVSLCHLVSPPFYVLWRQNHIYYLHVIPQFVSHRTPRRQNLGEAELQQKSHTGGGQRTQILLPKNI